MLLFADQRSFPSSDERFQHCTGCGKDLVVLPNDRRGGSCYDCLSLSGTDYAVAPEPTLASVVTPHLLALDGLAQAAQFIEHLRRDGRFPEADR